MKFYVDEDGNKYQVDRETQEKILIQPAGESESGNVSDPEESTDNEEE